MNIFESIENFSYMVADKIGYGDSEDNIELYRYSIFMIFSQFFTMGSGFLISLLLGCTTPYIIITIVFALLRRGTGGFHCDTFAGCYLTSITMLIIFSMFSTVFVNYYEILFIISIIGAIYIFPICPKPSENSPSRGYSEDVRFRKIFRNYLIIFIILNIICMNFGLFIFSSSISFGILEAVFATSDIGEFIIKNIVKL